jgi:Cu/Ag efflux pump CusA
MALVVLGGLLSSTFLNMVVVPALFYRFGGEKGILGMGHDRLES